MAEGEDVHHSTELYLDRLGRCPADAWTARERRVLDRFALACFDVVLCPDTRAMRAHFLDDPLTVLLMFDIGGIDIDPLLELWLRCEAPQSTIQFVEATYWDFWEHREYCNAFAADRPAFRARLREWLLEPAHRQRFAAKMLEPAFLELVPHQSQIGCTTFQTMADGVFDCLAQ